MKFNIAYPATAAQKTIEVDDERKLRHFLDKKLGVEVAGESLGDQFKGYVFRIGGGFDKQGFSMKQGVNTPGRVRLLMSAGTSCYKPRRSGERKRKSVRGCVVSNEISVLNLVVVKKGDDAIPGLTDKNIPRRLGPKRASKIRRLFDLGKKDDVRKYVIRRELPVKEGDTKKKKRTKAPKIQRLVTPITLQRKRHRVALKKQRATKNKTEAAAYAKLLAQRAKEKRQSITSKRRSVKAESTKADGKPAAAAAPTAKTAKAAAPTAAKAAPKAAAKTAAKTAAKAAPKAAATTKAAPKAETAKAAPKAAAAPKGDSAKASAKTAAKKAAAKK